MFLLLCPINIIILIWRDLIYHYFFRVILQNDITIQLWFKIMEINHQIILSFVQYLKMIIFLTFFKFT